MAERVDPDVDAEVLRILATFRGATSYRHDNADVRRIAALGRKAVPSLVPVLERPALSGSDGAIVVLGALGEARCARCPAVL